jgi:hypothetical protein
MCGFARFCSDLIFVCRILIPTHSLQFHQIIHLDLGSPIRQTRDRLNICPHVPPVFRRASFCLSGSHGGVYWLVVCSWNERQCLQTLRPVVFLSFAVLTAFNSSLTAFALPDSMLCTKLFRSSGVNLGSFVSSAWLFTWSFHRYWDSDSHLHRAGMYLVFCRYLDTLSCTATRPECSS